MNTVSQAQEANEEKNASIAILFPSMAEMFSVGFQTYL